MNEEWAGRARTAESGFGQLAGLRCVRSAAFCRAVGSERKTDGLVGSGKGAESRRLAVLLALAVRVGLSLWNMWRVDGPDGNSKKADARRLAGYAVCAALPFAERSEVNGEQMG